MTRLLIAALLLIAACTGTGAGVPEGWTAVDAGGLRVAHPEAWQATPTEQRGYPGAAVEVTDPASQPVPTGLVVFAEQGVLADLDLRADITTERLRDELDAELVRRDERQFPGGLEGRVLEFVFAAETDQPGETVPFRQVEVVLTAEDGRTYDVLLGGPADRLDDSLVDGVLESLRLD